MSSVASAQNLTANRLQLLPASPSACPTGRVCVIGTSSTSPYRVGFRDASGNLVTMGDAWRLRQCSGACVGALNGDLWYDTSTGIALRQTGRHSTADWCVIVSGDQRNYHRRISVWRNAESCGGSQRKQPQDHQSCNPTLSGDAANRVCGWSNQHGDGNACATKPHNQHNNPADRRRRFVCRPNAGAQLHGDFTVSGGMRALWHLLWDERRRQNGTWQRQQHQRRWILGPNGDTSATATLVAPPLAPLQRHDQRFWRRATQTRRVLRTSQYIAVQGQSYLPMLQLSSPVSSARFAATLHTATRDSRRSAADPHHHKQLEPSGGSASPPFGMLIGAAYAHD